MASYNLLPQLMKLGFEADAVTRVTLFTFPIDFITSSYATQHVDPNMPLKNWLNVHIFCTIVCAASPVLLFLHEPPPTLFYWCVLTFFTVALKQCGVYSFVTMYTTFGLYCKTSAKESAKNKLTTQNVAPTATQMTVLGSILNIFRLTMSTFATYAMHWLNVLGHLDEPYYALSALSFIVGGLSIVFIVRRKVEDLTFTAINV
eukprot:PhM_4_TR3459/c0_g1_i2/m.50924